MYGFWKNDTTLSEGFLYSSEHRNYSGVFTEGFFVSFPEMATDTEMKISFMEWYNPG